MKKFKRFAVKRPVWFTLLLIVLFALLLTLTYPVNFLFPETRAGEEFGSAVSNLITILVFTLLLWRFGWLEQAGLTRIGRLKNWWWILLIGVYDAFTVLYAFTESARPAFPAFPLAAAITANVVTGAALEEFMFRGLALRAMIEGWGRGRRNLVISAVLSSAIFGTTHLLNMLNKPPLPVLFQAVVVILPGILYAALTLSERSIWPAVALHIGSNWLINLTASTLPDFAESPAAYGWLALFSLPLLALAAYLLWKVPAEETP